MLKLEKSSNLSDVAIRVRERESFFESRLLKALAIALLLHGGALVLFQITPFHFSSTFTFPPIHVQSETPTQSVSAMMTPYIEEEELLAPPLSFIPALDWISSAQDSTLMPSLNFDLHSFQHLEEKVWPKWEEPLSVKLEEPRIQLTISGELAEFPLVKSDPLLSQMQPISAHDSAAYVTYQVQLDAKSGELFWYERTESSGTTAMDQLTENILLNLRFSSSQSSLFATGILNFIILP